MTGPGGDMPNKKNNRHLPAPGTESGVSEVIGAILLISLVVIAVSVIAVVLFSQQTPQKIPNVNIMAGTDNKVPPTLYLYHNGGDTLTAGDFNVLVDGVIKSYSISGGGNEWSLGKNLVVPVSTVPKNVVLVYNSSGTGSVVLRSASVNVSAFTGNINPDVMSFSTQSGTCNIGNCSPDDILDAFMANVTSNYISFYKEKGGSFLGSNSNDYHMRFRVTDPNSRSSITYHSAQPVRINLSRGDTVTITLRNPTGNFRTFGISPQIWELSVDLADISVQLANGTDLPPITNEDVIHTFIAGYDPASFDSTLVIDASGMSDTALTVNSSQVISGPNDQHIVLSNVRPLAVGLFLISQDDTKNGKTLFVGRADGICVNTDCGPFGD
jgi:FlaG/FlaF family flagellin (archaellin)